MLQAADTIGVFQVESRAQMATLPRLKPERFYDIVVQVAIIRPGPIVGQMVHPYLDRRAGRAPVVYAHPSLEPILKRTLGVPLFQEQLLRMAMVTAGFSGGQAEELRRAFGFKRSERRMKQIEVQLREGMARQSIGSAAADEIVRSIASFALYGFPESHAASFALLAYASAYLKVPLSCSVLRSAVEQSADGLLPSCDARQGCPTPRCSLCPHRCAAVRLALHDRRGWPDQVGPDVRGGVAERSRTGSCEYSVATISCIHPLSKNHPFSYSVRLSAVALLWRDSP